jgi:hypothetical protein
MSNISGLSEAELREQRKGYLNERLLAYREDLAEWFSSLFQLDITENTFLADIGELLCRNDGSLFFCNESPSLHQKMGHCYASLLSWWRPRRLTG